MATGDTPDIVSRLRNYLAPWFGAPGLAPVLTAILTGGGTVGAFLVALIAYAQAQTRIATATGGWLNLIALDYFGTRLRRRPNQGDESFRARILAELLRPRVSRQAMRDLLVSLTGREPTIFEPSRPLDTGTYAPGGATAAQVAGTGACLLAWNTAGGWGSLDLPGQFFVDVLRSPDSGVPLLAGWGSVTGAYNTPNPEAFIEAAPLLRIDPITPGWTPTGTVARAHTPSGAMATYFAAGGVLAEAAQNVPRVAYDPVTGERLGWLLEPARTNLIPNPRAEGAAAGSPGTLPTDWFVSFDGSGMSYNVVGSGSEDGIPYCDIRISGTAAGNQRLLVRPHAGFLAGAASAIFAYTAFVKLQAAANPTVPTIGWNPNYYTAASTYITEVTGPMVLPTSASLKLQRNVAVLTTVPTTAKLFVRLFGNLTGGVAYDFTLRIGAPQIEAGEFATSPILPPVGSPQVSTRGGEIFSNALPSAMSSGVLYVEQRVEASATAITEAVIAALWDGSFYNSARVRVIAGAAPYVDFVVDAAGVTQTDGANIAVTLGGVRRDVAAFATNRFAQWSAGVLWHQDLSGTMPSVTALAGGGYNEAISYIRDIRVYAPLTDAQALALSGTGSTLAPLADSGPPSGLGQFVWISPNRAASGLTDADILDAIVANKAMGTNAWVRIST